MAPTLIPKPTKFQHITGSIYRWGCRLGIFALKEEGGYFKDGSWTFGNPYAEACFAEKWNAIGYRTWDFPFEIYYRILKW